MPFSIRNVAGVYRFLIYCDALNMIERLADGHIGYETNVLGGHDRACGVSVEAQQTVDHLSVVAA
jgi:hypothetical protein